MGLVPVSEESLSCEEKSLEIETLHLSPQKIKPSREKVNFQSMTQGKEVQEEGLQKLLAEMTAAEKPSVSKTKLATTNKIKLNSKNMGLDTPEEICTDLGVEVLKPELTKFLPADTSPCKMASRLAKCYGWEEKEEICSPLNKTDAKMELPTYTSTNIQVAEKESKLICEENQQELSTSFQNKLIALEVPILSVTKFAIRERASSGSREQGYAIQIESVFSKPEKMPDTEHLKLLGTIKTNQERAQRKSFVFGFSPEPETANEQNIVEPKSGQATISDSSKEVAKKVLKLSKPLGVSINSCYR
jgi:hypothetical protein